MTTAASFLAGVYLSKQKTELSDLLFKFKNCPD
jgi:hypothetical protein